MIRNFKSTALAGRHAGAKIKQAVIAVGGRRPTIKAIDKYSGI